MTLGNHEPDWQLLVCHLQYQSGLQQYFIRPNFCRQVATIYIDDGMEQNSYEVTRLFAQPGKYFPSAESALHMARMGLKHQVQPLLYMATSELISYTHVAMNGAGMAGQ